MIGVVMLGATDNLFAILEMKDELPDLRYGLPEKLAYV